MQMSDVVDKLKLVLDLSTTRNFATMPVTQQDIDGLVALLNVLRAQGILADKRELARWCCAYSHLAANADESVQVRAIEVSRLLNYSCPDELYTSDELQFMLNEADLRGCSVWEGCQFSTIVMMLTSFLYCQLTDESGRPSKQLSSLFKMQLNTV